MDIKRVKVSWQDKDVFTTTFTFWCNECEIARRSKFHTIWESGTTAQESVESMYRLCVCRKCNKQMNRQTFDHSHQWKFSEALIADSALTSFKTLRSMFPIRQVFPEWTVCEDINWTHNPDTESESESDDF